MSAPKPGQQSHHEIIDPASPTALATLHVATPESAGSPLKMSPRFTSRDDDKDEVRDAGIMFPATHLADYGLSPLFPEHPGIHAAGCKSEAVPPAPDAWTRFEEEEPSVAISCTGGTNGRDEYIGGAVANKVEAAPPYSASQCGPADGLRTGERDDAALLDLPVGEEEGEGEEEEEDGLSQLPFVAAAHIMPKQRPEGLQTPTKGGRQGAAAIRGAPMPRVYEKAVFAVEKFGWQQVHAPDATEWTALHWAASVGRSDVCARLIRANADPQQPDHTGRAALDYALEAGHMVAWRILAGAINDSPERKSIAASPEARSSLAASPSPGFQRSAFPWSTGAASLMPSAQ